MRTIVVVCGVLALVCGVCASEIHDAARTGNLDSVKTLLTARPELISAKNDLGHSPLHSATYNGQVAVAEYLLSKGADINALTTSGSTPLHGAAFYNHPEAVKLLIAKGANLNVPNVAGYMPLLSAAAAGNTEIVRMLIEAGADRSTHLTEGGFDALQVAVYGGHQETAEYLLSQGFDINKVSESGENYFHAVAMSGNVGLVKLGFDRAINPDMPNRNGETPLQRAILSLHLGGYTPEKGEIVRLFIAHGADVNHRDNYGETPLSRALFTGNKDVVKLLIDSGANVNNINIENQSSLLVAVSHGDIEIVRTLIQAGADTEIKEIHYGLSPLHQAVLSGDAAIAQLVADNVKDINITNNNGYTALDFACKYGHKQIADMLKAKGGKKHSGGKDFKALAGLEKPPKMGNAEMWYLGHCGWAIRTKNHLMIFDYFPNGKNPTEPSLANGRINPEELKNLNVEVFVTHDHRDHYDSSIYSWQPTVKDMTYIFGFRPEQLPEGQRRGYVRQPYVFIDGHNTREIDGMKITGIRSNEGGAGFFVEVDGLKIFHAGDHAGWENGDSLPFTSEIDYLATVTDKVDMAFINTTGCRFSRDTLALQQSVFYAIRKLSPQITIPTHGIGREYVYRDYAKKIHSRGFRTEVLCAEFLGDHFEFTTNRKLVSFK
jgi:ankyrin repeat protein/L-ascorbate metabolism protein UlaG (beta-lactamase superfamily)